MKILFCGDLVGRAGRDVTLEHLPILRAEMGLDFVVVNAENAAHGFGLTQKICEELFEAGADAITTGNHVWDQREVISFVDSDPRVLRPLNYTSGTPGRGASVIKARDGRSVLVVNVMCRLFMELLDDPFVAVDNVLKSHALGKTVDAVLIDVHGEATSEKMALGHFCDGRASLVVGTHTHIPTADAQVLPGGTAYQTDAGMCGDYDSVIGMLKETAIAKFRAKIVTERLAPARGPASLCGVYVETDDATGLAARVAPLVLGGRLRPAWPDFLAPREATAR
jgi:2',3'-cyclic-nucleotide 2'-phosphodiesterase